MSDFPELDPADMPSDPLPPPPAHHVDSVWCSYGWISRDPPRWLPCDCEDPSNPWPPRRASDGPRECECSMCTGKSRRERGRPPCEHADHHCESCHQTRRCTGVFCLLMFEYDVEREKEARRRFLEGWRLLGERIESLREYLHCVASASWILRTSEYDDVEREFAGCGWPGGVDPEIYSLPGAWTSDRYGTRPPPLEK